MFQLLNLDEQFDLDSFLNISQYQARIHSESLRITLNRTIEPVQWFTVCRSLMSESNKSKFWTSFPNFESNCRRISSWFSYRTTQSVKRWVILLIYASDNMTHLVLLIIKVENGKQSILTLELEFQWLKSQKKHFRRRWIDLPRQYLKLSKKLKKIQLQWQNSKPIKLFHDSTITCT